jgi:hypothetical protein
MLEDLAVLEPESDISDMLSTDGHRLDFPLVSPESRSSRNARSSIQRYTLIRIIFMYSLLAADIMHNSFGKMFLSTRQNESTPRGTDLAVVVRHDGVDLEV